MVEPGITSSPADSGHTLRGSIGIPGIVFLVVAAAAPLTAIGGALPVMLAISNGPGVPLAYLAVAVVLLLFSVGYATMSHHVVDTGAFYAYVTRGLGTTPGLGAAGLALLAYTAIQAAVYGLAATTLRGIITHYGGPEIPWWVLAAVLLLIVAALGYRSIDVGARVLGVMLVLEMGVLTVLAATILVRGGPGGYSATSFAPSTFFHGAPGIAIMFAVASFIGFEATAIYGEEARDPRRTIPAATYIAVVLIGVFYAICSWAVVVAYGPAQVEAAAGADTSGLVFSAAARYLGTGYADVMNILLLTSLFAALLAFHNAIARYLYALGRQGVGPEPLARTHHRHGSPYVGSLAQTVSAAVILAVFVLAGSDPVLNLFTWMSGLATVSILVLMVLTGVAILAFFARHRVDTRIWHTRVAPALGLAGLAGITVLVLLNFTTLISGSATLAAVLLALVVVFFAGGLLLSRFSPSAR
ncbi:amino acid transporter [Amycolatopsis bartoniae]|uniref:Amino acid transporter n=1 Tax=Amycolatopsis bartoniae TaxID=941986 RepID=A0A8H9J3V0_9PSEU|nr:APC family permease [Amycolatopsis bartoniae]MBB2938464.1 amino acid transporter [Amycolatopsis bartoniae]TVT10383.1 APC family permease [Amycolatopsis bartoniae]GHF70814.1 amino acid transporter [Amycolatopsis bartoniae]